MSTQNKSSGSSNDLINTAYKDLKEKSEVQRGYYRHQEDCQIVINRTPEQKRIFDEYFVVPNMRTTTCTPIFKKYAELLSIFKIPAFIIAIISFITGIFKDVGGWYVFAVIMAIAGVGCLIAKKHFLDKFKDSIKYSNRPKKLMTDDEYEALVEEKIKALDVVKLGLKRLGLDTSQVDEISPIILRDKVITNTSLTVYNKSDRTLHSSTQYVTVFYFTSTQLFVYKIQFDMCCNLQEEWTSEFFYRDICDISTYIKTNVLTIGDIKLDYNTFAVSVISSNSSIGFELSADNNSLSSIDAMRHKIRLRKLG